MTTTNQIKPLTHEQKIRILEEIIKFGMEHRYTELIKKTRRELEILRGRA
jgi:hypothetical protein